MDLNEAKVVSASLASALDAEEVELRRALGRVLASDLGSRRDIPGESRSKWDGFAFSSRDGAGAGKGRMVALDLSPGEVVAAREPPREAVRGACYRIMTGAILPRGTDAVIRLEDADLRGGRLFLDAPFEAGSGVICAGSDARRGEIMLEAGDVLTPTRIAIAAATGLDRVMVIRRPRVAVLATGSELVDAGLLAEGPVVFGNNIQLLASLVDAAGGEPELLGIAPDDPGIIASRLADAHADLVLTTGGMGKGSKDFMPEAWRALGIEVVFDRLNISPGKGSALGSGRGSVFLGLPGNPWAARIVYEEIAAPMIRRFLGLRNVDAALGARLRGELKNDRGQFRAFGGTLRVRGSGYEFVAGEDTGRGGLPLFRNGLTYALLRPQDRRVAEGETVRVRVPDLPLSAWAVLNP